MTLQDFISDKTILTDKTEMGTFLQVNGMEPEEAPALLSIHIYVNDYYIVQDSVEIFSVTTENSGKTGTLEACEKHLFDWSGLKTE